MPDLGTFMSGSKLVDLIRHGSGSDADEDDPEDNQREDEVHHAGSAELGPTGNSDLFCSRKAEPAGEGEPDPENEQRRLEAEWQNQKWRDANRESQDHGAERQLILFDNPLIVGLVLWSDWSWIGFHCSFVSRSWRLVLP